MARDEPPDRITADPRACFGKPCIKGHRIGVSPILDFLAGGWGIPEILANDPGLAEDIRACIADGLDSNEGGST